MLVYTEFRCTMSPLVYITLRKRVIDNGTTRNIEAERGGEEKRNVVNNYEYSVNGYSKY